MIYVVCNQCGQDDWRVRFPATLNGSELDVAAFRCTSPGYGDHAQIVQCQQCGLVYANPRWSDEELKEAYAVVEDELYQQERAGRELTFARHLRALEKMTGAADDRSLLDVGAYIGVFVEVATKAGWNAVGVEPSSWAVREAQKRHINVLNGTQESSQLQGRQFDVVTMWDVIEHVSDPAAELGKAFQLLKPGGWLAVHTMDIGSVTARLMGRRWPWLMDMHLYYFSQKSLAQMMVKSGFDVISSGAQGRFLRLSYLATRLGGLDHRLGSLSTSLVRGLRLDKVVVPINFGDLFTVYARRPE